MLLAQEDQERILIKPTRCSLMRAWVIIAYILVALKTGALRNVEGHPLLPHWERLRFPSGIIPQGTVKSSSQDFNFIRSSLNPHIKATSRFIHKRWKLIRCYTFENRDEMFFAELLEHHNWGPLATLIGISKCVWPPASFFGTQKFAPYQNSSCLQFCTLVDLLPSFRGQSDLMASIMKRMFVTFSLFYR